MKKNRLYELNISNSHRVEITKMSNERELKGCIVRATIELQKLFPLGSLVEYTKDGDTRRGVINNHYVYDNGSTSFTVDLCDEYVDSTTNGLDSVGSRENPQVIKTKTK